MLCVTQDVTKYDVEFNGLRVGLYATYGHDRDLFNLVSRTCSAMFMYEQDFTFIPEGKRIVSVKGDSLLRETLEQEVGGVSFREVLNTTTPSQMFRMFTTQDLRDLRVSDLYPATESLSSWDILLRQMARRQLYHRHRYRGKLWQDGKIVYGQFCSALDESEKVLIENVVAAMKMDFKAIM